MTGDRSLNALNRRGETERERLYAALFGVRCVIRSYSFQDETEVGGDDPYSCERTWECTDGKADFGPGIGGEVKSGLYELLFFVSMLRGKPPAAILREVLRDAGGVGRLCGS